MTDFWKIHNLEKRTARQILRIAHDNIRAENSYIRQFRDYVAEVFLRFSQLKFDDQEQAKQAGNHVSELWSEFVRAFGNDFRSFLSERVDESNKIFGVFSDFILQVEGIIGRRTVEAQKIDFGQDVGIFQVDEKDIDKFLSRRWAPDKKLWSERIAEIVSGDAQKKLESIFVDKFKAGDGYRDIIREAKKYAAADSVRLERIIRTEGQRIQNDILMKTYHVNRKYLSGLEYTATLDTRTCEMCGSYDREQYWYEPKAGDKIVTDAPYIPVHPLCRCVYVPVSKEWSDQGMIDERASMYGPTTGNYENWLKEMEQNEPGFAKNILGKNYNAWINGNYKLNPESIKFEPQSTIADFLKRERLTLAKPEVKPKPKQKAAVKAKPEGGEDDKLKRKVKKQEEPIVWKGDEDFVATDRVVVDYTEYTRGPKEKMEAFAQRIVDDTNVDTMWDLSKITPKEWKEFREFLWINEFPGEFSVQTARHELFLKRPNLRGIMSAIQSFTYGSDQDIRDYLLKGSTAAKKNVGKEILFGHWKTKIVPTGTRKADILQEFLSIAEEKKLTKERGVYRGIRVLTGKINPAKFGDRLNEDSENVPTSFGNLDVAERFLGDLIGTDKALIVDFYGKTVKIANLSVGIDEDEHCITGKMYSATDSEVSMTKNGNFVHTITAGGPEIVE